MNYLRILGVAALSATSAFPQYVISAKSGLINYTEGKVFVEDKLAEPKAGEFPEIKKNEVLRTEAGRAEILFSPGVFLRVGEASSFKMVSNALEDTVIELTSGSVLLEAGEVEKDQFIRILVGATTIEITKQGLFRVDADPARLRVYEGSATVLTSGAPVTVKEGRQTLLAGVLAPEKFNKEVGDPFHRWAGRRAGYIAMANLAAAKALGEQNTPWRASSWLYNPYFGSFTYIPFQGRYMGPFGWAYYSPRYVERVYYNQPNTGGWSGNGMGAPAASMSRGYGDMGGRGSMSSSGGYSAPAPSASSGPAPSAAPSRGADSGGGSRDGRGGR